MPGGSWNAGHSIYSGSLYSPTGAPFYSYDAQRFTPGAAVGNVNIIFSDDNYAILDYTIRGASSRKRVTRMAFGSGPAIADHADLWWGGSSQNGWGISVLQQASTLFSVWYTYWPNGKPIWYVMPGGAWTT